MVNIKFNHLFNIYLEDVCLKKNQNKIKRKLNYNNCR